MEALKCCQMLCQNCFNVRKQKTTSDGMIMCLQRIRKVKIKNGVNITIIMAFFILHHQLALLDTCISPYSIPLCTILTKCPAPSPPT